MKLFAVFLPTQEFLLLAFLSEKIVFLFFVFFVCFL